MVTLINPDNKLYKLVLQGSLLTLPRAVVFQSTDEKLNLSLIKEGYVKRYFITNEGVQGIQIIYGPNDIFPMTSVLSDLFNQEVYEGPEVYYYETITPVKIYRLDIELLQAAIEEDEKIYADLFKETGKRLTNFILTVENMNLHSTYNRLAHMLLYYCVRFGMKTPVGTKILLPLTHETMANLLGVTRETISHCMIELNKNKIIKPGRLILVPDIDKLRDAAYSS